MVRSGVITAAATLCGLASALPNQRRTTTDDSWKSKIKNVIVLVEENRSFDTFLGGLTYRGDLEGLVGRDYCNPV